MSRALISILVPCHNAAPWLETALSSALRQTWPRVEIILVDDGSTDGSDTIARSFASSRCRVVRREKGGASAARNHAFTLAQGDYVQYLDADDFLAADKLERQLRAIEWAGADTLSFGSVVHFFDAVETGERHVHPARLRPGCADPVEFLIDLWGETGGMVQTSQWLTPRALIEKAGPWNEKLSVDDDGEFFARVVLAASRLLAVPEACTYYRKFRRGNNLSALARWDVAGRRSALQAAQMKSTCLLARSGEGRARQAVCRLLTREIVDAYPACPEVMRAGMQFLRRHGLSLADPLEGSPWFLRLYPWLGWKTARRLQESFAQKVRAQSMWEKLPL